MGLKDLLEKMKLVEFEESEAATTAKPVGAPPPPPPRRGGSPPPPATTRPSLTDVVKDAGAQPKVDEAALARAAKAGAASGDAMPEVPDFPAIYTASGVSDPPHGFSAYKVLEMLSSSDFAALEPRAKAAALSGFLKFNPSGPVPITDVIEDALRRDQALDAFEEFLRKKLDARREQLEKDSARLQAEIDELTQRNREAMDANRRALEAEKERFATWQARKRIEERKLHDAVAPFVEDNPVSLGSGSTAPAGTPKPPGS
jgi:hypothetical protein